uniref:beta-ketoacyl synthase N-terminal-like domain-containing protein n=2 Tax=Burkholderia gladioli TaxID=28095 RepID=UPI001FC851B0
RPDAASVELMRRTAGLVPLENEAALAAFAQAVTGDAAQVLVAAGEREKLLALFGAAGDQADDDGFEAEQDADEAYRANPAAAPAVEITAARSPAAGGADLSRMVSAALLDQASVLIKVKPEDIDLDEELAGYGFDSISLTELATELNRTYELDLMPTVFFEHPTLAALTAYLVDAHRETMARHFAPATEASAAILPAAQTAQTARRVPAKAARRRAAPLDVQFDAPAAAIAPARAPLDEPIAIVGLSARMPMAEDADAFWQNLLDGRDCIEEIPAMRWDWQAIYGDPTDDAGRTRVKWGGFIDGIDEFDPHFFGITPREAQVMDPQQRLLMTHVWKAIEDAGYSAQALSGSRTALFVGTSLSGYGNLLAQSAQAQAAFTSTSVVPSIGPNRMSYFLNLHGPSEPIETACSSSLVAINRGIAVLRDGSCEMAIVGGINTIVTPDAHVSFSKAGMLSEDGRCKTFSAEANGYVRGEGVGMLVLKRLSDAQAAGDAIYAVIRGGSENHGGRASSLTAPNPQAQAALLMDAYRRSGVDPRTLSYIEAHGTGTKLGDPVEITGLKSAFANLGVESGEQPFCGLGSVKSNIGHLELAAGVAGVIKVVMQMKHATLVKSLHSEPENPYIGLSGSPFYVVRENRPWVAPVDEAGRTLPRRAGVSSFGFGGVNAHVVLEEYVAPVEPVARPGGPALVVLSARTEAALTERAAQLLAWLERNPEVDLYALAYTLQVGRDAMDERLAWAVDSLDELRERLGAFTKDGRLGSGMRGQAQRNKEMVSSLAADEDLPSLLATWLAKGKWDRLLSMWVKGLALDWQIFYPARRPRRLHLPSYTFAAERYWIEPAPAGVVTSAPAQGPAPSSAAPVAAAASEAGDDTLLARVCGHAGRLSGLPAEPFAMHSLHELGLDSVFLLQLSSSLIAEFKTQGVTLESSALLRCASAADLAACIEQTVAARAPTTDGEPHGESADSPAVALPEPEAEHGRRRLYAIPATTGAQTQPVEPPLRRDPRNQLCETLRIASVEPVRLDAKLVVDESHAFFFDHPLDHVSGLHLGAAMSEAVQAAHLHRHGLPADTALFVSQVRLHFVDLCRKEPGATIHVSAAAGASDTYQAQVVQNDREMAHAEFVVSAVPPRPPRAVGEMPGRAEPAPARSLNKHDEANVLLSEVRGEAGQPSCALVMQPDNAYFGDFPASWIDIVVLAEAARQSMRLFTAERRLAASLPARGEATRDVLKALHVALDRPLYWDDAVELVFERNEVTEVGDASHLRIDGVFVVDGQPCGRFSTSALSLSAALQEAWARRAI